MKKLKSLLLISAIALTLPACKTTQPVYLQAPSGNQGFIINCSGLKKWKDCYIQASEICNNSGYTVIDKDTSGDGYRRKLFAECKQ